MNTETFVANERSKQRQIRLFKIIRFNIRVANVMNLSNQVNMQTLKRKALHLGLQLPQSEKKLLARTTSMPKFNACDGAVDKQLLNESCSNLLQWIQSSASEKEFPYGGQQKDGWPNLRVKDARVDNIVFHSLRQLIDEEAWTLLDFLKFKSKCNCPPEKNEAWDYIIWGVVGTHFAMTDSLRQEQQMQFTKYRGNKG